MSRAVSFLYPVLLFISTNLLNGQYAPALKPPMGWNSYDCFGAAVTEEEVRQNALFMSEYLKDAGWEYVVIDYCWYYPHPPGSVQENPPQFRLKADNAPVPWMPMDEFGRLLPDPRKFPSAAGGEGFRELGDYIHSLGLKFGIHIMRGIPRQAVWTGSLVKGAGDIQAGMIADTTSFCSWLNLMWGVDMEKEGAQEYYNSLFELYASWGVDFVKIDDMNGNGQYHQAEAEACRKAVEHCKRPMVISLSPGMDFRDADHMSRFSDMWRISGDFWDEWEKLRAQFEKCAVWAPYSRAGSWPDADMIPIGNLRLRGPFGTPGPGLFTPDEQQSLMSLWAIFQSPLMIGSNLPDADSALLSLLTNKEVISVNQNGKDAREVYRQDEEIIWLSLDTESEGYNLAVFNISDESRMITVNFKDLNLPSRLSARDLWKKEDILKSGKEMNISLPPHGSGLYRLRK